MPNIPAYYDFQNVYNSTTSPSTMHCQNTALTNFFAKYLLQKAISVFKWTLPETWAKNYFLYSLYAWGPVAIVKTDKFGVIPQACGLQGYNVYYQPKRAVISNPLFRQTMTPEIDEQCVVLHMQPDYSPIIDIVAYYADLMALASETIGTNLVNSKLAYVFATKSKGGAESYKKMFDKIGSGEPAVFVDKALFNDDGSPSWFNFAVDGLKNNYIVDEVLSDLRKLSELYETEIGIPNANTDKRERLITDEVNANNVSTYSKCELWLESLREGIDKAKEMFDGLDDLSVDWRETHAEIPTDPSGPFAGGRDSAGRPDPAQRDEQRDGN